MTTELHPVTATGGQLWSAMAKCVASVTVAERPLPLLQNSGTMSVFAPVRATLTTASDQDL